MQTFGESKFQACISGEHESMKYQPNSEDPECKQLVKIMAEQMLTQNRLPARIPGHFHACDEDSVFKILAE